VNPEAASARSASASRRLWAWLATGRALALLSILVVALVLLAVSAWSSPLDDRPPWRRTPGRSAGLALAGELWAIRGEGGRLEVHDASLSASDLADVSQREPDRLIRVWHVVTRGGYGPAFPVVFESSSVVHMERSDRTLIPADAPEAIEVRRAVADWYDARGGVTAASMVRGGDFRRVRVLWWGVVLSAITLAVGVAWMLSVARVLRRLPGVWRRRRLRRGVCPACGYNLSAISAEHGSRRCPECGRLWRVEPGVPAPSARP
jgi:hypothetical protein